VPCDLGQGFGIDEARGATSDVEQRARILLRRRSLLEFISASRDARGSWLPVDSLRALNPAPHINDGSFGRQLTSRVRVPSNGSVTAAAMKVDDDGARENG
jgi:hypothetical protein